LFGAIHARNARFDVGLTARRLQHDILLSGTTAAARTLVGHLLNAMSTAHNVVCMEAIGDEMRKYREFDSGQHQRIGLQQL
jgi:hypothetical protein